MKRFPYLLTLIILSCTSVKKNVPDSIVENANDTTSIIKGFIYGLWSMDSENILLNRGFYFRPDGTFDMVAEDATGNWDLDAKNSIVLNYGSSNKDSSYNYKIDSITDNQMILSDSDGKYVFRKVPFGLNTEGTVLQGFTSKLEAGESKEYSFNIPSAKKIALHLKSEDPKITFRVYEGKNEVTAASLRTWNAIMIRSGNYNVIVTRPKDSGASGVSDFDLKVFGY